MLCGTISPVVMESQRSVLDAVGQTELQVERQYLVPRTVFAGIETLNLPTYILQHQTHLEGGVLRLEMGAYIGSDGERCIALVDAIDRLERHAHFPARMELTRVHHIYKDIACAERTARLVAVLVCILHRAVIEIVNTDSEVIGFVRFAVTRERFLYLRAAEVMPVQGGTEHRAGQIIGIVELERHVGRSMQQRRIAHRHGDISIAEADVRTAEGIELR